MNAKTASIIVIIASLAIIGLTYKLRDDRNICRTDAKETHAKLDTRTKELADMTTDRNKWQKDSTETHAELDKTKTELASTKDTLATTEKNLASTKDTLETTQKSLDETKGALTAANDKVSAAEKNIADLNGKIVGLGKEVKDLTAVKTDLLEKNSILDAKVLAYQGVGVPLPATLVGKVMSVDSQWNFVVLNIGTKEGVRSGGVMIVGRGQDSVGKVKIALENVLEHMAIANILSINDPKGTVKVGDDVLVMQ